MRASRWGDCLGNRVYAVGLRKADAEGAVERTDEKEGGESRH